MPKLSEEVLPETDKIKGAMTINNPLAVLDRQRNSRSSANRTCRTRGQMLILALGIAIAPLVTGSSAAFAANFRPFVPAQGSTVPSNGDLNPYGLVVVPNGFPTGTLRDGQLLVANFNNGAPANVQGEGSTIVMMDPNTGQQIGVFFQGTPPIGFTNALGIVKAGFVFAGSVSTASAISPAANGESA